MLKTGDPAFIVSEVAAEIDGSEQGVRNRMNAMIEDGLLEKKKSGPRTVIYWPTKAGITYYAEQASGG